MSNYSIEMKVRDYECDIQGVVNNSVYQNYLEHARHEFLLSKGLNFFELAQDNVNLMVVRAEIDYKVPLKSGDEFIVDVKVVRASRVRFDFVQQIVRKSDNKLAVSAKITGTAVNERGRPFMPDCVAELLDDGAG